MPIKTEEEAGCEVLIRVPDEQAHLLPAEGITRVAVSHHEPLPRQGEVVFLAPTSAWGVRLVVHEWHRRRRRVEVWLEHVSSAGRPTPPPRH